MRGWNFHLRRQIRSLKKAVLGKAGGSIGRNNSNVVVIEALRDITHVVEAR